VNLYSLLVYIEHNWDETPKDFLKDSTTVICFTIKISSQSCNTKKLSKLPQQDQLSPCICLRSNNLLGSGTPLFLRSVTPLLPGQAILCIKKCVYSCQTSEFFPLPLCTDISFSWFNLNGKR